MQKGFSTWIIVILVAVVAAISFNLGTKVNSKPGSSTRGFTELFSAVSTETNIIPLDKDLKDVPVVISQPKKISLSEPTIVSTGIFQFSDHKINYTFSFPKSGGDINGQLEGVCSGSFVGKYNGEENNSITGTFSGICTAGPLDLIKTNINANFSGDLNSRTNKVYIKYNLTDPISYQGSFDLDFRVEK